MTILTQTAQLLLADHKGLLAMDESNGTCNKRFARQGSRKPRRRGGAIAN